MPACSAGAAGYAQTASPGIEISVMAEPSFSQHAVAFLDILGFKNFIASVEVPGSKAHADFCRLQDAIDGQLHFLATKHAPEQHLFPEDVGLKIIQVSDSFVLSAPVDNQGSDYSGLVAVAIKTIQLAHRLLAMRFLLRGGIAVGSVYRTDTNIFGTGYQDAYGTESNLAKTPRVLLHSSAAERLERDCHLGLRLGEFPIFMRDGQEFILDTLYMHWSYVGNDRNCDLVKTFSDYKVIIEGQLSNLSLGPARDKWKWMASFFNAKQRVSTDLRSVFPIDSDQSSTFAFGPGIEQPKKTFEETFGRFMAPKRYL
jgi:hypothetical protein